MGKKKGRVQKHATRAKSARGSDAEESESGDLSGTSSEKQRPLDTRAELREATKEEASRALDDFSWIDLTEPDPKHNCVGATEADLEGGARQRDDGPVRTRLPEKGQAK